MTGADLAEGIPRRKFLAAASVALMPATTGCTGDNPKKRQVQVSGLNSSDLYYGYEPQGTEDQSFLFQSMADGFQLALYYDTDLDYNPVKNVVYVQQQGETVNRVENGGGMIRPEGSVEIGVPLHKPGSEATYRVISMDGPEKYDEFDLTVRIRD